jgi:hypothetical protein
LANYQIATDCEQNGKADYAIFTALWLSVCESLTPSAWSSVGCPPIAVDGVSKYENAAAAYIAKALLETARTGKNYLLLALACYRSINQCAVIFQRKLRSAEQRHKETMLCTENARLE